MYNIRFQLNEHELPNLTKRLMTKGIFLLYHASFIPVI